MKNHRCLVLSASTLTETSVNSVYRQDIKQINHGFCPGYTVHIPPLPSGFALVLGVVYERYIHDNHGLSIRPLMTKYLHKTGIKYKIIPAAIYSQYRLVYY